MHKESHTLSPSLFYKHIHTLEYKSNISICTSTDVKSGRANFLPVLVGLEGTDLASLVVIVQEGETAVTHEAGTLGGQLTVMNHPSDETTTIKSFGAILSIPTNSQGCLFLFPDF